MVKKIITFFLALVPVISALPGIAAAAPDEVITITIIHTNDMHGRMDAAPYISQMAKDMKAAGENVLILDAGDALHGQITANLTEGETMVELMNEVGYSAMVPGNHEFNYGLERLLELSAMTGFPILAANVTKNDELLFTPYKIFPVDGISIGVFGIATPETVTASDPRNTAGLTFLDPEETAITMVSQLQSEGCDIIIALAHLGSSTTSLPKNKSEALAVTGVDVIIDGHSHTVLDSGHMAGDTLIVQAGQYAQYIGVVEIVIVGSVSDGNIFKTAHLIEVSEELSADTTVFEKIAELDESVEDITKEIVGYTPVFLNGDRSAVRTGDTNLSNIVTDSMLFETGADIAMLSGGSIRDSIPAGDITMGHVLTVLPFSNLLVTMDLSGSDILEALEHGVSLYPEEEGLFMQVSGLSFVFDPDAPVGSRVISVSLPDGTQFDKAEVYTVALPEFLAAGGDGYTMFISGENLTYYGDDAEAFAAYLAMNPTINSEAEGRVKTIGANSSTNDTNNSSTGNSNGLIYILVIVVAALGITVIVLLNNRRLQQKRH